jgi:tetratricopeptide (TPR) repeat protein
MRRLLSNLMLSLLTAWAAGAPVFAADETNAPAKARDLYNEGTKLLAAKKYADAERALAAALAAQDARVQPPAMFNLGHVRFADGLAIKDKGPDAQKVTAQANAALAAGENAIRSGEASLVDNQMDKMVSAYLEGRGARHDLRAAEKAVKLAMDMYGKTLIRWQRADDDFKGVAEMNPADTNAVYNSKVVEQAIAKLVDSLRQMQQMAGMMAGQKQQLDKTLGKLKGKIPAPDAPPGGKGDDDEDEGDGGGQGDVKPESLTGKEENAGRDGNEIQVPLSPDQAVQMLDGLPVDAGRRLPIGGDQQGEPPKDRHGRNW